MSAVGSPSKPADFFEMMLAYKTTALLTAGIDLGVFDALATASGTSAEVAEKLDLSERGARFLDGLAALGLARVRRGDLRPDAGQRGASGAGAARARRRHGQGDVEQLGVGGDGRAARRGAPRRPGGAGARRDAQDVRVLGAFAEFAGAVARPTAELAANRLDSWASGRSRLDVLDVACGHGLYGFTLATRQPHARIWSLDWPNVLPLARKHAAAMGVSERASTIPGDMFEVPLGGPYNVVMVTNVLHHFSPERGVALLRRLAPHMAEDGRLVLVGFVTHDGPPAQDAAAHLFSVLMLVWTLSPARCTASRRTSRCCGGRLRAGSAASGAGPAPVRHDRRSSISPDGRLPIGQPPSHRRMKDSSEGRSTLDGGGEGGNGREHHGQRASVA